MNKNTFQSHTNEPKIGDKIINTNIKCKHYKSEGTVIDIKSLDHDMGKIIIYKVTNNGDNYKKGMVLHKTMDQISPNN